MPYDDSTRLAIMAIRDADMADMQGAGIAFAENVVRLATTTRTGGADSDGTTGSVTIAYTTIKPAPVVDLTTQYRDQDRTPVKVGDARLEISRTYTRTQIEGAAWIEIDGDKYTVIAGSLRQDTFVWVMLLKREQA